MVQRSHVVQCEQGNNRTARGASAQMMQSGADSPLPVSAMFSFETRSRGVHVA
jgi:hypothetical protein